MKKVLRVLAIGGLLAASLAVSGEELRVFEGHENAVTSVAFSPDGERVVSGSWDDTLRLWQVR